MTRAHEDIKEIAIPLLARRQAGPLPRHQVARRLDDSVLTCIELVLRGDLANDQSPRHVGWAHVEPWRRWIVRQSAGPDDRDAHVLIRQKLADRLTEGAHAA